MGAPLKMYEIRSYSMWGMDRRVTVGRDFFSQTRRARSIDCAHDNISRADIWSCFMANTFLSPRFRVPGRSFSRRAASSSQSERDSLPPAVWLVVAMDHFLSPTACSLPIRASLLDRPYSRVVATVREGRTGINFKATSLAASPLPTRFACVPRMCVCNPLRKGRDPRPTSIGIKKISSSLIGRRVCLNNASRFEHVL